MAATIRTTLTLAMLAAGSCGLLRAEAPAVPIIHTTDLFHPPADPDDHLDLATALAFEEFDVRAVLLDVAIEMSAGPGTPHREPGFVPVVQLSYLTGKGIPVAMGPAAPLRSPSDPARDRPRREQAAIELMLEVLRKSPQPVYVQVLGSARIVTAAYNRDPALLKKKVKAVLLNAGSAGEDAAEYNVRLDREAYVGLFRSGLPIDWYPCAAAGPNRSVATNVSARNTYWKASHAVLFRDVPRPLLAWFVHGFTGNSRGDLLRALEEQGRGYPAGMVMAGSRNMWSTASMALAAGRVLAKTPEGWRFVPAGQVRPGIQIEPMDLEPVAVTVQDDGRTQWKPSAGSNVRLFRRKPGPGHDSAMAEATNALFRSLPVE